MSETLRKLPKHKCHKIVHAAKIKAIDGTADFGAFIHFEEDFDSIQVGSEYIEKHKPQVGGYYVIYEDGYESWSPAEAFEAGYTATDKMNEEPNEKQLFKDFLHMAKRKLNAKGFGKIYTAILPVGETIPNCILHLKLDNVEIGKVGKKKN